MTGSKNTGEPLYGVTINMSVASMITESASPSSKPTWNPHDYQRRAISMMLSQGSVGLFLDPGLGKTSIVLGAFKILKQKKLAKKMLVVAPLRPVYSVWPKEIHKWTDFEGFKYVIIHGADKEAALDLEADVYLINVDAMGWLADKDRWKRLGADVLCIDESTKFKNTNTVRFKSLRPLIQKFQRRWILTGTPAPNGIPDLFGQIFILDQGAALGRFITHFRNEFMVQQSFGGFTYAPRPGAFEEITERIKPLTLRLSAQDYLNMPELRVVDIPVTLPPAAMKIYKAVEDSFFLALESSAIVAANAAAAGTKCRQIANGAVYDDNGDVQLVHDEKLLALEDLLEELSGKPTLVVYEYIHDLTRLQKAFPGEAFTGNPKKDDEIIGRFAKGEIPILYLHPQSAGHGIDSLQDKSNNIVFFGLTWNLEYYDQIIARVWRQGQKENHVTVYRILAEKTRDMKVAKVLLGKDRTQKTLLEALKS